MGRSESYIPVSDINSRIAEVRDTIQRLSIELEALERIRRSAAPRRSGGKDQNKPGRRPARRLGPKDAILALLATSPALRARHIVDRLENQVRSDSENVRRTISSTIYNLRHAGVLEMDEQGRLSLAKSQIEGR